MAVAVKKLTTTNPTRHLGPLKHFKTVQFLGHFCSKDVASIYIYIQMNYHLMALWHG